jgi:hypothetical protein
MNASSLDLRKKIVEARQRGMPTSEVAETFGVGVSSVKRYAATAREGRSLAPKERPGSKPKMEEAGGKAPGGGPKRAPDGHAAPEARGPLWRGRGAGERIHDLPRA